VISFWVTGVCFLLGYPLAYFTVFHVHRAWVRRLIYVLLITPLFTSNIVRAFGWIVILGRRGIVNSSLLAVGLIEIPLDILYSKLSIIGLSYILLPVMVLSSQRAADRRPHADRGRRRPRRSTVAPFSP
jgi:putative spermidine/putrescine transport system permease protein